MGIHNSYFGGVGPALFTKPNYFRLLGGTGSLETIFKQFMLSRQNVVKLASSIEWIGGFAHFYPFLFQRKRASNLCGSLLRPNTYEELV